IGLPFSVVMYLIMIGLYKVFRVERYSDVSYFPSLPGQLSGRAGRTDRVLNWRKRLSRSMSYAGQTQAEEFITTVATPAVREVAAELRGNGAEVSWDTGRAPESGISYVDLQVSLQ